MNAGTSTFPGAGCLSKPPWQALGDLQSTCTVCSIRHLHAESCFHKDSRIQKELFCLFWLAFLSHTASLKQEVSVPLPFRVHTSPPKCHIDSIDKKLETNSGVSRFLWIPLMSAHWWGSFQDTQSPLHCIVGKVRQLRSSTTTAYKPR